ncbi:PQQ-binding-like beta-propeller repeat protein [bacterium]|nr:PQQ-binding-like beta-propeller repeat protein [bacterium]
MPAPGSHNAAHRFELTHRQQQVIELLAHGKTNFEIAQELGISLEGAKYHVRELLNRLGVDSREEAVALWNERKQPAARIGRALRALPSLSWVARITVVGAACLACTAVVVGLVMAYRSDGKHRPGLATQSSVTVLPTPPASSSATTENATADAEPAKVGVSWNWNTGDAHDFAWFDADSTSVAVAVAPLSPDPGFVAYLDASTGYERWHHAVPAGAFLPALTSDAVVFGTADGTVWALSRSSSDVLWTVPFPGVPFQTLAADGTVVVGDADPEVWGPGGLVDKTRLAGRVWGIDARTGTVLWKVETGAFESFIAISGNIVVISTYDPRDGAKTETLAVDSATGQRLWEVSTDPASTPPVIARGKVFVATAMGTLSAFDLQTGRELWTARPTSGGMYSFPSVIGNSVLAGANTGALDARNANDGSLLWSAQVGECRVRAFAVQGQTFLFICGWIGTVGADGGEPKQWLVPQGEFQWVEPIASRGILASSYTGEGPVTLVALVVANEP